MPIEKIEGKLRRQKAPAFNEWVALYLQSLQAPAAAGERPNFDLTLERAPSVRAEQTPPRP